MDKQEAPQVITVNSSLKKCQEQSPFGESRHFLFTQAINEILIQALFFLRINDEWGTELTLNYEPKSVFMKAHSGLYGIYYNYS